MKPLKSGVGERNPIEKGRGNEKDGELGNHGYSVEGPQ